MDTQPLARARRAPDAKEPETAFVQDLETRLARLHDALGRSRQRLVLQDSALRGLREELGGLARRLERLDRGARALEPVLLSVPAGAPAPDRVGRLPLRKPAASRWLKALPYAALAACALALGARSRPAGPRPLLASAPPPRVLPAPVAPPGPAEEAWSEEQARDAALELVLEFRPEGAKGSVAELLAPELQASSEAHPWVLERTAEGSFFVAFRPYGEALGYATPIYEFEVDLKTGKVSASPETLRSLGGGSPVAAR